MTSAVGGLESTNDLGPWLGVVKDPGLHPVVGPLVGDAQGVALLEHQERAPTTFFVEFADGTIKPHPTDDLFRTEVNAIEERALSEAVGAGGPILDIGCGAGRQAVVLQERGGDVTGMDVSPGALEVCIRRGLHKTVLADIADVRTVTVAGGWGVLFMGGYNLGLLGGADRGTEILAQMASVTRPGGILLAESSDTVDPRGTYFASNLAAGRLYGEKTMRLRYKHLATPWFRYTMLDPEELEAQAAPAGWTLEATWYLEGDPEHIYFARLRRH